MVIYKVKLKPNPTYGDNCICYNFTSFLDVLSWFNDELLAGYEIRHVNDVLFNR